MRVPTAGDKVRPLGLCAQASVSVYVCVVKVANDCKRDHQQQKVQSERQIPVNAPKKETMEMK